MNNRKKIIYLVTKANFGGAQRYVFDLATNLPKEEFDVLVVSGAEGILTKRLAERGIRTISIHSLKRNISLKDEMLSFFKILKILKNEKPDIIHLNSSKAAGLGALAARLYRIPKIIFTVHGWPFNEKRSAVGKRLLWFFSFLTVLLATDVIVIARQELAQGRKMPFIRKKLLLVHNGILPPEFTSRAEAREKLKLPQDAFVVGSLGELTSNKNYLTLVRASELLKRKGENFILTIIGGGEGHDRILAEKNSLGLSEQVLKGFVEDGYRYLSAYDIFVLPSFKEGLPYVLLEAGQASLPVIASNVGGIPDIIDDNVTGILVDPKNTEDIAEAILRYKNNENLRKKLGIALKTKVQNEFSFSKMFEKTSALYKKLHS